MKNMDTNSHENLDSPPPPEQGVVVIPFDYQQLPEAEQRAIVPICIASRDCNGNPIAKIWFEKGVAPVQQHLRNVAQIRLGDVWRVSELAERTVHKLWERHGEDGGSWPWRRVLVRAVWEARDIIAGGSPWYVNHFLPLTLDSIEVELYASKGYDEVYDQKVLLDLIERRINQARGPEYQEVLKMLRQGYTWDEVAQRLADPRPAALKRRFWRWMNREFPK